MPEAATDFLANAESLQRDDAATPLQALRRNGAERFAEVGFPNTKAEQWRFTDVTPILKTNFSPALPSDAEKAENWWSDSIGEAFLLTVQNGFVSDTSASALPDGLTVRNARGANGTAVTSDDLSLLGAAAAADTSPFTALNAALVQDTLVLDVAAGADIPTTIHIRHSSAAEEAVYTHPRTIIRTGTGSRVRILESYSSENGQDLFVNPVTEMFVGANAQVDHVRLQDEGDQTCHVGGLYIRQEADSRFTSHAVNLGGHLARNDIQAWLDGQGIECTLNGLYLGNDSQLHDTHSVIHHQQPNCTSHELYKGVLGDQSRGVFSGLIHVYEQAQKTDSYQTNRALLMSDDARVNAMPQLLIFADDVKCSHGSTVGQLDEKALFYLQSRGIDRQTARGILTVAFAAEAISDLPLEGLRHKIEKMLLQRFSKG